MVRRGNLKQNFNNPHFYSPSDHRFPGLLGAKFNPGYNPKLDAGCMGAIGSLRNLSWRKPGPPKPQRPLRDASAEGVISLKTKLFT